MTTYRRYRRPPLRQSTKSLTFKLTLLAVIATLAIGGLIATQMAAGNDPALGPKLAAKAKKRAAASSGNSSASGTGTYGSGYGDDGYSPYDYGSGGYSSGSGGYTYSPPPVTSSTS
jgi:uncharacterized membrane protein YgcG